MSMISKTRLIMAIRGYKTLTNQQNVNHTDISALDSFNKKILLRVIDSSNNRYADLSDVLKLTEKVKLDAYDSAFLISNNFTESAINEMEKQNIQCISNSYMPPFAIEDLYRAILRCASNQCNKTCGKTPEDISECAAIKDADLCKTRFLVTNAKAHFKAGTVGLLKNDLKIALASGQ